MQDIDVNNHVNNVVYIEWALEAIPANILKKCQPEHVEISFKGEAFYNEAVISRCSKNFNGDENIFLHQIVRKEDGKELARLRTKWTKS